MATKKSQARSTAKKAKPSARNTPAAKKKSSAARQPKHDVSTTDRPESPELEGLTSLPEELTGRASRTDESLSTLFDNQSAKHMTDGFHGGSGDDGSTLDQTDNPGDVAEEEG
jgi:hypothetical protein